MPRPDLPSNTALARAFALLGAGEAAEAEAAARAALNAEPGHAGWSSLLALALTHQHRADEALVLFEHLVDVQPRIATHWSNLGQCLCDLGRARDAVHALARAVELGAGDDTVHFGLARAYADLGPAQAALHHIDVALASAPADVEYRLLRARILLACDELPAAREAVGQLMHVGLSDDQSLELARLALECGRPQQALAIFEALPSAGRPGPAMTGRLLALERLNRIEEALCLTRAPAAHAWPPDASARHAYAHVQAKLAYRNGELERADDLFTALDRSGAADADDRATRLFDHAAVLVRQGRADEAMRCLAQAHKEMLQRALALHPQLATTDLFAVLEERLPVGDSRWPRLAADGRAPPAFVVGFPRSGTTLLEQILDAHPALASFDEQPFVQSLARALYARSDSVADGIERLSFEQAVSLRERYYASVESLTGPLRGRRPVDKNPLNLIRLGILHHFFPGAAAVLVLRHPCDVVLSCYMQQFSAPSFAIAFATLDECASMYHRVFRHWSQLPCDTAIPTHVVRYEDLVVDVEGEARRLLRALGLEWSPQVLDFAALARAKAIGTPSYSEVVKPVHGNAMGRWLRYRHHFSDAALGLLAPWASRFGYALG